MSGRTLRAPRAERGAELTLVAPAQASSPAVADHGAGSADDASLVARYRMISRSLHALSGATTIDTLLPLILKQLCRCGFERAWLTSVSEDALTITHLLHAGAASRPGSERCWGSGDGGPEGTVIRRREAAIIARTGDEPADPALTAIAAGTYVAAPLTIDTRVVAILSADHPARAAGATEADREIIAAFARVAGEIIQRTLQVGQLERLRADLRELTGQINARADTRLEELLDLAPATRTPSTAQQAPLGNPGRIHEVLTRRELEIMRLIAGGETNASIARLLVISDGTVKTHVRSILRKLRATNRATAIARYYKLTQA